MCNHNTRSCAQTAGSDEDQAWTVNDILRQFGPAYLEKYRDRMSLDQIKALKALIGCRSESAGVIAYRCRQCGQVHMVPKSCGNRHCPTCQGAKAKDWLAEARTAAQENRPEKAIEAKRGERPGLCDASQMSCLAATQDKTDAARVQLERYGEDLARYEKLIAYQAYEEIFDYRFSLESQFPRYAPMAAAQRAWLLRAALAVQAGNIDEALLAVERDIAVQRVMLVGSCIGRRRRERAS